MQKISWQLIWIASGFDFAMTCTLFHSHCVIARRYDEALQLNSTNELPSYFYALLSEVYFFALHLVKESLQMKTIF